MHESPQNPVASRNSQGKDEQVPTELVPGFAAAGANPTSPLMAEAETPAMVETVTYTNMPFPREDQVRPDGTLMELEDLERAGIQCFELEGRFQVVGSPFLGTPQDGTGSAEVLEELNDV